MASPSRSRCSLHACAGMALLLAGTASVQAQYSLDGYAPQIAGRIGVIAVQPDGKALVGGEMNDPDCRKLCRLLVDGRHDPTFDAAAVDGTVDAIVLQPDGRILIGGYFSTVDGQPRARIARLHADGSLDASFAGPTLTGAGGSSVRAIAVHADGRIMIGGVFDTVDGQARRSLARLSAAGSVDDGFVDPQLDGGVNSLAWQADGKLVFAGGFTSVGGVSGHSVARLDAGGRVDATFSAPVFRIGADVGINALATQADGKLLVAGRFTEADGQPHAYLVRLAADGRIDTTYVDPGIDGTITSLIVQPDDHVLLGGFFLNVGGQSREHVARLAADGTLDTRFANPGVDNWVGALALQPDGKILVTGDISEIDGQPHGRLARLTASGRLDANFDTAAGANAEVFALAPLVDDKVLVGGSFTAFGGNTRGGVARLHHDGSLDTGFADPGASGEVLSLSVFQDTILVAGSFASLRGQFRHSVGRLKASNGALDGGFGDPHVDGTVYALDADPQDGTVMIGGDFTTVAGAQYRRAARLQYDGSLDTSYADPRLDDAVLTLARQPDGKVLLGGAFTSRLTSTTPPHSLPCEGVARFNADGSFDAGFANPGVTGSTSGIYRSVMTLAVQPDGKVLIGGSFDRVGGQERSYLARLNADGSLDTDFPDLHLDGMVTSIVLQSDGRIVIAGTFTRMDGPGYVALQDGIARLTPAGHYDPDFANPAANGPVYAIALQADGKLLAGGGFDTVDGQPRGRVARLALGEAALQSLALHGSEATWLRSGTAPELATPPLMFAGTAMHGEMTRIAGGWRFDFGSLPPQFDETLRASGASAGGAHNASHAVSDSALRVWREERIFTDGFE